MELNLLFLPLLGGYIFYKQFNLTAHAAIRASGEHLLFAAAGCGLVMLMVARVAALVTPTIAASPEAWRNRALCSVPLLALICVFSRFPRLRPKRIRTPSSIIEAVAAVIAGLAALILCVGTLSFPALWLPSIGAGLAFLALTIWLASISPRGIRPLVIQKSCLLALGVVFLFAAVVGLLGDAIHAWSTFTDLGPKLVTGTDGVSTVTSDNLGTAFLACFLGATLWFPLNTLVSDGAALAWLHSQGRTDALDAFLHASAEAKELVQLSLADGKFYIGNIQRLPPKPSSTTAWVRILPMISGYREEGTKALRFTTFYQDVYAELAETKNFSESDLAAFVKIVPVSSIVSANLFRADLYIRFEKERGEHEQRSNPTAPT